MNPSRVTSCAFLLIVGLPAGNTSADTFGPVGGQFTIDFVPISSATNPSSGFGRVYNDYRIGTFEVTNDQWSKFESAYGTVTGSDCSYMFSAYWPGSNVPTTEVCWFETAQFVNWLNTSTGHQPAYNFSGTQGTSDYTMVTWTPAEADNGTNLYRHKDAFYYLPTEDEWVKAAYWNGTSLQMYANASPNDLVGGVPDPTGWNYGNHAMGQPWNVGTGFQELNGTYDMMGNVMEIMESPYVVGNYDTHALRVWRGGAFNQGSYALAERYDDDSESFYGSYNVGFRVASDVPEPSSFGLLALAGSILLKKRRHPQICLYRRLP